MGLGARSWAERGSVVNSLEKPAFRRPVAVDPTEGAALQRDVPLVAIPSGPGPDATRSPSPLTQPAVLAALCRPPAARRPPRAGGLHDGAVRHAARRRREMDGTAAFDRHTNRRWLALPAQR